MTVLMRERRRQKHTHFPLSTRQAVEQLERNGGVIDHNYLKRWEAGEPWR